MVVDQRTRKVVIDGQITIESNATADLLIVLATRWLEGAGKGLEPLDFPLTSAATLAKAFDVGEEAVRRRVLRAKAELRKRLTSAGMDAAIESTIIENQPWHGYRLAPDRVTVRSAKLE